MSTPPRHLVALPTLPQRDLSRRRPGLWRRVFDAMSTADEQTWADCSQAEQTNLIITVQEKLAMVDAQAAEAMFTTIKHEFVNHLLDLQMNTVARMVALWFDQQIEIARKGE